MTQKILIIQTGTIPAPLRNELGDFSDWFAEALDAASEEFFIVRVFENEKLPQPSKDLVAIITGSLNMVTERLEWSEKTAEWIKEAFDLGMPMFGVCYGHQLMAYALGGKVDFNPKGREMGSQTITLSKHADDDPVLRQFPQTFVAQLTHMQAVLEPPHIAISLAFSNMDSNQILRYSESAMSTQFHPEFTEVILRELILSRRNELIAEGADPDLLCDSLSSAPIARALLTQFIDRYR